MQRILVKVMNSRIRTLFCIFFLNPVMLLLSSYAHSAAINLTYVKFAFPLF